MKMKRFINNLTLIIVVLVLGSGNFPKNKEPSNKTFSVTIEQNGETKNIKKGTVLLDPDTFDIVIKISEPMGLLVNASFKEKTFKLASRNKHLDKLPGFEQTGMAEGLLNSERELFISCKAPNYWFYNSSEENRFNIITKTDNGIICKRTIGKLFDTDNQTYVNVIDIDKPMYLVFVSYNRGENVTDIIEVQRQYIEIKWKK